ncbi:MAG: hypothetical protein ABI855_19355, partial [Bacteroidota bacterium]
VQDSEYILFTEKLLSNYKENEINETLNWLSVEKSEDTYDYIGSIKYRHISLEPLLNEMRNKSEEKIKESSPSKSKS